MGEKRSNCKGSFFFFLSIFLSFLSFSLSFFLSFPFLYYPYIHILAFVEFLFGQNLMQEWRKSLLIKHNCLGRSFSTEIETNVQYQVAVPEESQLQQSRTAFSESSRNCFEEKVRKPYWFTLGSVLLTKAPQGRNSFSSILSTTYYRHASSSLSRTWYDFTKAGKGWLKWKMTTTT